VADCIIVVTDGDAAIAIAQLERESDGVFIGFRLPNSLCTRLGVDDRVTQHTANSFRRQPLEVEGADRIGPLGQEHAAALVEQDF
jgi:hypothetical protein